MTNRLGTEPPAPLVSVCIASYNQEQYIERTVLSALEQDYQNLEVIVADDGSEDGTPELLRQLAGRHRARMRLVLSPVNSGIPANSNRGLGEARGDLVALLAGDDLMCPGKISRQVAFMSAHPGCTISYHDIEAFDSDSDRQLYLYSEKLTPREGDAATLVEYGAFCAGSTVMFRHPQPVRHLRYDERVPLAHDWLMYIDLLMATRGMVRFLPCVLARYRRHDRNATLAFARGLEDSLLAVDIVQQKYPQLAHSVRLARARVHTVTALSAIRRRWPLRTALRHGVSAVRASPLGTMRTFASTSVVVARSALRHMQLRTTR